MIHRYIPEEGDKFRVYVITRIEDGKYYGKDINTGQIFTCTDRTPIYIHAGDRRFRHSFIEHKNKKKPKKLVFNYLFEKVSHQDSL